MTPLMKDPTLKVVDTMDDFPFAVNIQGTPGPV